MTDRANDLPPPPPPAGRRSFFWLVVTLLTILPLLFVLSRELWQSPFPINETVSLLEGSGILSDDAGSPHSLSDPRLADIYSPATRSWYRPFYWTTWYGFWHLTHSLDATLLLFRLVQVLTPILLILGMVWHLKPRALHEYAAAVIAVAVLVGTPGFRENLEVPLLMTLVGMLFAMLVWILLEREHRPWQGPAIVLLIILAVGYKEQGLVLVPIVVGAWLAGAPGVRRGTALVTIVLTLAYLAVRFETAGSWRPFEQDVGFGFRVIPIAEAAERFAGAARYGLYAYNAVATVANILFSEPTDGTFRVVQAVRESRVMPSQIINVITSTATTILLLWWGVLAWRQRGPRRPWTPEFRMLVGLVLAVGASGALGFNYSRDRLGGMAVVFYALAAYYAFRSVGLRLGDARPAKIAVVALPLLLLSTGWHMRALGSADWVEMRSRKAYREWVATRYDERKSHTDRAKWLEVFSAMEPQGVKAVPGRDPLYERWAYRLMGTR